MGEFGGQGVKEEFKGSEDHKQEGSEDSNPNFEGGEGE